MRLIAVGLSLVAVAASATPAVARRPNAVGRSPIYTRLGPADLGLISGDPYFDELAAAFRADHGG